MKNSRDTTFSEIRSMSLYLRILKKFPGTCFSFAYGSAVKRQKGYDGISHRPDIIDFAFIVEDPIEWHTENLKRNETHYSSIKRFGSSFVSKLQESFGARVYYNTLVHIAEEACVIKYGVVSKQDLIKDLEEWLYLYLAGRLHKPVAILEKPQDIEMVAAINNNYESAVRTSLLLLPEYFTKYDLFYTLCGLSYTGDFRMIVGENKKKLENIVAPQLDELFSLYSPVLDKFSTCVTATSANEYNQDKSTASNERHLQSLPKNLKNKVISKAGCGHSTKSFFEKVKQEDLVNLVHLSVKDIVRRSSILQSIKNIPTAGLQKSIYYSLKKFYKTFES